MSSPPSKEADAEGEVQTPETEEKEQEQPMYEFEVKEQDRWLPIANVARIMKTALPENAKIAKEAKECMQECVSEFISFITSEASEKCQQEKRKTVNGEDILFAMTSLGFENYAEALKIYLAKYRETQSRGGESRSGPSGSTAGAGSSSTYEGRGQTPSNQTLSPEVDEGQGNYPEAYSHIGNGVSGAEGY